MRVSMAWRMLLRLLGESMPFRRDCACLRVSWNQNTSPTIPGPSVKVGTTREELGWSHDANGGSTAETRKHHCRSRGSTTSALGIRGLRAPVGNSSMGVGATIAIRGYAMLMVEQHEAYRHCAQGKEGQHGDTHAHRVCIVGSARHALGGGDLDVDATAKGEEQAVCTIAYLVLRENDAGAQHNAQSRDEVGEQRKGRREVALLWVGEYKIIGDFLRELVVHCGSSDAPADGGIARVESGADEDTVHQVVHKVAHQDARENTNTRGLAERHHLDAHVARLLHGASSLTLLRSGRGVGSRSGGGSCAGVEHTRGEEASEGHRAPVSR
mmetsp:Transcript_21912/g.55936  ORF Transcript_21912/g.55936 Transcript_21912/m.55936 type:complete len:326 (+) Transcript_21912:244-1221(+)